MTKTITIRLSEEEYNRISLSAKTEHRPISNFITHAVLDKIEREYYVDSVEMAQINSDERLKAKLKKGHKDAASKDGQFID